MTEPLSFVLIVGKGLMATGGALVCASVADYMHSRRLGPLLLLERGIRYLRAVGFLMADVASDLLPTMRDRWPAAARRAEEQR